MSRWVNAGIRFGKRLQVFRLPIEFNEQVCAIPEEKPDELEKWWKGIITHHQPSLNDGALQIIAMHFNYDHASWEAIVSHPSFERVREGAEIPWAEDWIEEEGDSDSE